MGVENYPVRAGSTAIYPEAGTGSLGAVTYLALGLAGEAGEALGAIADGAGRDDVRAELGDVLWYTARLHDELRIPWCPPIGSAEAAVVASGVPAEFGAMATVTVAARVADHVKKALRDDCGALVVERRKALAVELGKVLGLVASAAAPWGLSLDEIADANVEKLAGRKLRGVLQGSGDHR